MSRLINFNLAWGCLPLSIHNPPNNSVSSNIEATYSGVWALIFISCTSAWCKEQFVLQRLQEEKEGGHPCIFPRPRTQWELFYLSSVCAPFISSLLMYSLVDSYQGQDKEILLFLPSLITYSLFRAHLTYSTAQPGLVQGHHLIQRSTLCFYTAIMGGMFWEEHRHTIFPVYDPPFYIVTHATQLHLCGKKTERLKQFALGCLQFSLNTWGWDNDKYF